MGPEAPQDQKEHAAESPAPPPKQRRWELCWPGFLHLFALGVLAVAAPLFENITVHQQFLIAHHARSVDLVCFALLLGILVPSLVALLALPSVFIGPGTYRAVHAVFVWLLSAAFYVPLLNRMEAVSGELALALCVTLGAVTAGLYWRLGAVRTFLAWLAPVALICPAAFLFRSEMLFSEWEGSDGSTLESVKAEGTNPVFFMVFDEFSTQSLMTPDKNLDSANFPNFAALAETATWFRNSTAVAETTGTALPPLLTGNYPKSRKGLPTSSSHPINLFTILNEAGYSILAAERGTRMCPESIKTSVDVRPDVGARMGSLLVDTSVIFGHLLLKGELAKKLPPIGGRWVGFIEPTAEARRLGPGDTFDAFLELVSDEEQRLYYVHTMLPHLPYRYLPSGKFYTISWDLPGWSRDWSNWRWNAEDGHAVRSEKRYLLQVGYVDTLIGRLIDRLKYLDIYDRSLIVITADHGVSYRNGHGRRRAVWWGKKPFGPSSYDILKVPCFIKMPHQQRGAVVDTPFQSIDILPSVLSGLNISANRTFDGRDVFADKTKGLAAYQVMSLRDGRLTKHTLDILSDENDISYKARRFDLRGGFGIRNQWYDELVGRQASLWTVDERALFSVELLGAENYHSVDLEGDFLPAQIRGVISVDAEAEPPEHLAIAVNGMIRAVARTYISDSGHPTVSAIVPETAFRNGVNRIEMYALEGEEPKLLPATLVSSFMDLYLAEDRSGIHARDGRQSYLRNQNEIEGTVTEVESIGEGRQVVRGWAADLETGEPATAVVLFLKNRVIAVSRVHHLTHTLKRKHKNKKLTKSGFEFVVSKDMLEGIDSMRDLSLFALSDKTGRTTQIERAKLVNTIRKWIPGIPDKLTDG